MLEFLDRSAERWLGHAQMCRCLRKIAMFRYRPEISDLAYIHLDRLFLMARGNSGPLCHELPFPASRMAVIESR